MIFREAAIVSLWTTWWIGLGAFALDRFLGVPFVVTYLLGALTLGPFLAVNRGRNRERDALSLAERAVAEAVALAAMLGVGWAVARFI